MPDAVEIVRVSPLNYADRFVSDGSGEISKEILRVPGDLNLEIERIVIRSSSASFSTFALLANELGPTNTREFTRIGPSNVADEFSPVVFLANERVIARWTGLDATTAATITMQGWYTRQIVRAVPDFAEGL